MFVCYKLDNIVYCSIIFVYYSYNRITCSPKGSLVRHIVASTQLDGFFGRTRYSLPPQPKVCCSPYLRLCRLNSEAPKQQQC